MRLLVTVGYATDPFDRLLQAVERALADGRFDVDGICQAGASSHRVPGLERVDYLPRAAFQREMARADVVVCHAGVGTIRAAVSAGHRPLVMARRRHWGEHVNDHQLQIVRELVARRSVRGFADGAELRHHLERLPATGTRLDRRHDDLRRDLDAIGRCLAAGAASHEPSRLGRSVLRLLGWRTPAARLRIVAQPGGGAAVGSRRPCSTTPTAPRERHEQKPRRD